MIRLTQGLTIIAMFLSLSLVGPALGAEPEESPPPAAPLATTAAVGVPVIASGVVATAPVVAAPVVATQVVATSLAPTQVIAAPYVTTTFAATPVAAQAVVYTQAVATPVALTPVVMASVSTPIVAAPVGTTVALTSAGMPAVTSVRTASEVMLSSLSSPVPINSDGRIFSHPMFPGHTLYWNVAYRRWCYQDGRSLTGWYFVPEDLYIPPPF